MYVTVHPLMLELSLFAFNCYQVDALGFRIFPRPSLVGNSLFLLKKNMRPMSEERCITGGTG